VKSTRARNTDMPNYNPELAEKILRVLNNTYPQELPFSRIKESIPNCGNIALDEWLLTARALHEEDLVECKYLPNGEVWIDIARVKLTQRGRRTVEEFLNLEQLGDLLFERGSKNLYEDLIAQVVPNLREQFATKEVSRSSSFVRAVSETVFDKLKSLQGVFLKSYIEPAQETESGITPLREESLKRKWNQIWERELIRARNLASSLSQSTGFSASEVFPMISDVEIRGRQITFDVLHEIKIAVVQGRRSASLVPSATVSAAKKPDLTFVNNDPLRMVLERDYSELQGLDVNAAMKSVLVLSGSIIEGLVLDALVVGGKWSLEEASKRTLNDLLNAALAAHILKHDRLTHAAKQYRNLVHPGREIRDAVEFSSADAVIAKAAVDIAIREVSDWHANRSLATNH
jgi:hypothetical protein